MLLFLTLLKHAFLFENNNEETENELAIEVGGYEHVSVLRNIKVVDKDAVEIVHNLKRGTSCGDCILYFGKHFMHT